MKPVALVVLADTVRADAPKIIGWFAENHVDVKVISGDNPLSVSVIAASAGVPNAGYDAAQIAMAMASDINLVALKVSELSRRGYTFRDVDHRSDFLK